MADRLLILGWHNVEGTWSFPAPPGRGPKGLWRQLRLVRALGHVVDLGSALDDLHAGRALPARAVALTFDDGYRDNLATAVPMLRRLGLPATFFLVPGILSGEVEPWWETLAYAFARGRRNELLWKGDSLDIAGAPLDAFEIVADDLKELDASARHATVRALVDELDPPGRALVDDLFLNWDGARELVGAGMAVGSHTTDHAILAREDPDAQLANLVSAREQLEANLGVAVDALAYPNGQAADFDTTTERAATDAGYRNAVTTIGGWNTPITPAFRLRRFVMHPTRGLQAFRPLVTQPVRRTLARKR